MYATTKIVKIAESAPIRENIPTRTRDGRTHSGSAVDRVYAALLNEVLLSIHISNPGLQGASGPKAGAGCAPRVSRRSRNRAAANWWTTRASTHPRDHFRRVHPSEGTRED